MQVLIKKNMEQWQKISKDTTDPLSVVKCRASLAYTCHQEKCPLCISISSKFNIIKHFFFFSLRSYTRHNQYSQYYKWTLLLHIVNPSDLLFLQVCVLTGTSGIRQNQWTTHVKPCSKLMTGSAFHRWPDNEGVTLKKLDIGTQFKHNHVFPIANV